MIGRCSPLKSLVIRHSHQSFNPFLSRRTNPKDIYLLEGIIISIEKDGRDSIIVVESGSKKIRLTLEKRFGVFMVGDKVRFEYEVDGMTQDVEMIEKI